MSNKVREEHKEQIIRWANFVRENPEEWKKHLKPFLDAQIIIAQRFYKNLSKSEEGREKIKLLKAI
ncbi:MAG: hypothetical protein QXH60_03005 [Candidatus Pacearchaeota archaeon]